MTRLLLLALLLTPLAGLADSPGGSIYRTTDEQGNVVFTDRPPADAQAAERVEVQRTNTTPAPPEQPAPAATTRPDEGIVSTAVAITSPAHETSFPMGPGNFSVEVKVKPELGDSQSLQLLLDGEPRGEPQRELSWDLTNVFRGQHDLTVAVIDASGQALATSPAVRVFVHRPSVNFRNR